jgi:hypothetical protein
MRSSIVCVAAWVVVVVVAGAGAARAHELGAEFRIADGRVAVETFYDDGSTAREVTVRVLDDRGAEVAREVTDDDGRCEFTELAAGTYQMVLEDAAEHFTTLRFSVSAGGPDRTPFQAPSAAQATPQAEDSVDRQPLISPLDSGTAPQAKERPSEAHSAGTPWLYLGLGLLSLITFSLTFWITGRKGGR